MNPDFSDIIAAVGRPPLWYYDWSGVPRYVDFSPNELGVYDHYALLVEIACQSCGQRFLVGQGWPRYSLAEPGYFYTLEGLATGFHFGDPPLHGCGGDSMNCVDIRIVEAWEKGPWTCRGYEWVRRSDVEEFDITPEWLDDWRREHLGIN
jgi:hypothetical protein